VRIRWRGVARVAAIVLVALLVLRLLPGLLHAPEPPPLGADVGLPKARPVRVVPHVVRQTKEAPRKEVPHPRKSVSDAPASTAKIGTSTRRRVRHHHHRQKPKPKRSPPPESTPEYVPPPAPQAVPEPLPEPPPAPPSTPGDGSQEFAPR
jgi:hypothetical protein